MNDIYEKISDSLPRMSKSQLKIAHHILDNKHTVPFFTVGKMAKMAGVSEATVVRFAGFLGLAGYPRLQQLLQDALRKQLTTVDRLDLSEQVYTEEDHGIYEIFQDDIANIKATVESLDAEALRQTVAALLKANRIYIAANRSAVSLGVFLEYYLGMIIGNTRSLPSAESAIDQLNPLGPEDVVIGISFARYTSSTIQTFAYAKEAGAVTVAITDNRLSPLVEYAQISLTASTRIPTIIDSFVAPLSLINALIILVGKAQGEALYERLHQLEQAWDRFDIFL
ncbi:MurR/RpiR family transcriptional regulator [Paenibacillus sp. P26]|nr:MurR/RpiR family transcriptional regulator [Paenibacillus sp. P26]